MSVGKHTTRNDITGDMIESGVTSKEYRDNFDNIKFAQPTCDCSCGYTHDEQWNKYCQECGAPYEY